MSVILSQKNVEFITPYYKMHLIQADEDDNKFVDCAFTAGASCIVSNESNQYNRIMLQFKKKGRFWNLFKKEPGIG